jgi:hypothetical protein
VRLRRRKRRLPYVTGSFRIAGLDAGLDALGLQRAPKSIGIIAALAEQPLRLRQIVQ